MSTRLIPRCHVDAVWRFCHDHQPFCKFDRGLELRSQATAPTDAVWPVSAVEKESFAGARPRRVTFRGLSEGSETASRTEGTVDGNSYTKG